MAFSLMNGLASMGQGIADFAGRAGLEQQKADLAQQQTILADQLAGAREETSDTRKAGIAAAVAEKEHGFLAGQGDLNRQTQVQVSAQSAAATMGAASISAGASKYAADVHSKDVYATIAAAEPEQAARILEQNQRTALTAVQAQNAKDLHDAHAALESETAKPDADPTKIANLKSQVTSLETSATTEAAVTSAAAAMYRTDMDAVTHFNTQLGLARTKLNDPEMTDKDKAAQKAQVDSLQRQLVGAQRALNYSSDLVHGRIGTATGNPEPGVAPTPPAGVPTGARYSPSMKIWQAPDGSLFDAQGKPTSAPGTPAPSTDGFMNNGAGAP